VSRAKAKDPGPLLPSVNAHSVATHTDIERASAAKTVESVAVDYTSDVREMLKEVVRTMSKPWDNPVPIAYYQTAVARFRVEAAAMSPGSMIVETDYASRSAIERAAGRYCGAYGKTVCGVPWVKMGFVRRGEVAFPEVSVHDHRGPRGARTRHVGEVEIDGEREDGTR